MCYIIILYNLTLVKEKINKVDQIYKKSWAKLIVAKCTILLFYTIVLLQKKKKYKVAQIGLPHESQVAL